MKQSIIFIILTIVLLGNTNTNSATEKKISINHFHVTYLFNTNNLQEGQHQINQEFQQLIIELNNKVNEVDRLAQNIDWNDYRNITTTNVQFFNTCLTKAIHTQSETQPTPVFSKKLFKRAQRLIQRLTTINDWLSAIKIDQQGKSGRHVELASQDLPDSIRDPRSWISRFNTDQRQGTQQHNSLLQGRTITAPKMPSPANLPPLFDQTITQDIVKSDHSIAIQTSPEPTIETIANSLNKLPIHLGALLVTPPQSAYLAKLTLKVFCVRNFFIHHHPDIDPLDYCAALFAKLRIFIKKIRAYQLVDDPELSILISDPLEQMIHTLQTLQNREIKIITIFETFKHLALEQPIIDDIKDRIKTITRQAKHYYFSVIDSELTLDSEKQYLKFVRTLGTFVKSENSIITTMEIYQLKQDVDQILQSLTITNSTIQNNAACARFFANLNEDLLKTMKLYNAIQLCKLSQMTYDELIKIKEKLAFSKKILEQWVTEITNQQSIRSTLISAE